jgi:hypothetical protein
MDVFCENKPKILEASNGGVVTLTPPHYLKKESIGNIRLALRHFLMFHSKKGGPVEPF